MKNASLFINIFKMSKLLLHIPVLSLFIFCSGLCGSSYSADFDFDDGEVSQPVSQGISQKNRRVQASSSSKNRTPSYGRTGANSYSGKKVPQIRKTKQPSSAAANSANNKSSAVKQNSVSGRKGSYNRKNSYLRKNSSKTSSADDVEIDQLPLPPPPAAGKKSSVSSPKDETEQTPAGDAGFNTYSRTATLSAQDKPDSVNDLSGLELRYARPSGWEDAPRASRGAAFAMQKNHAIFVSIEAKGECSPETALQSSRKALGQYKERDRPSKLKSYAVKNGVSGHYFYIQNTQSRNYYAFFCAGEKTLEISLTNADEKMFEESLSSLKMEDPGTSAASKKQRPKLQPVHYSTEDVGRR